ncbi:ParB/RepB/Spo0J family partition protein [Streptomyces sp. B6B3]|uniref:ParB/RepB/Spo0J family partition protein n=1 Tax=Streptomyces sp. B6B3 TaxID=3153570 RepID=UPI00325F2937
MKIQESIKSSVHTGPSAIRSPERGLPTALVPVDLLTPGECVRLTGIDESHVNLLVETQAQLPPILVHRETMRVIDGAHRLVAAKRLGHETIAVRFFDGSEDDAFVTAVRLNVAHGLPLTLADRRAAAARVVEVHAEWSDRKIAGVVGLSPKTVGVVRRSSTEEIPQSRARVGRDGRLRRLPERRRSGAPPTFGASDDPVDRPSEEGPAPRAATVDATVEEPAPVRPATSHKSLADRRPGEDVTTLQRLARDPALRMSDSGRFLLRLLSMHFTGISAREQLLTDVPPHCADRLADLARQCAEGWLEFAERMASHGITGTIVASGGVEAPAGTDARGGVSQAPRAAWPA